MKTIITSSFEETQRMGEEFAKKLKSGDLVCLYGDLGSGKTTFTQGLAKGLGVTRKLNSPTFIIVRTYQVKSSKLKVQSESQKLKVFYHIDLYRPETERDIQGLGLQEVLNDPEAVTVIEWAEKIKDMLPKKRIDIYFEYIDEIQRKIRFNLYE